MRRTPLLLLAACAALAACDEQVLVESSPPVITVNTDKLDYGEIPVRRTVRKSLTIVNAGAAQLEVERLAVAGDDAAAFSTSVSRLTLERYAEVKVEVRFSPTEKRAYSASLEIESNASNKARVRVALAGVGVSDTVCGPCDEPPPPACLTELDLVRYEPHGTCVDDACQYRAEVEACEAGCDEATAACEGATPDAALPDNHRLDATTPDTAGVDAGAIDATLPDTTSPDTAVPDATIADQASPDIAVRDAAIADQASPDTTPPTCPLAGGSWSAAYTGLRYSQASNWAVGAGSQVFTWSAFDDVGVERPPELLDPVNGTWTDIGFPPGATSLYGCYAAYTSASDTVSLFCRTQGYRFVVSSRTWQPMTSTRYLGPSAQQLMQATTDKVFLYDTPSWRASIYDPAADSFTVIDGSGGPEADCCAGTAWSGEAVYIWGPDVWATSNRGWKLDLATLGWSELPGTEVLPASWTYFTVFWVDATLVIADRTHTYLFDPDTAGWTTLGVHPSDLGWPTWLRCPVHGNRAFCFHDAGVEVYDATAQTWTLEAATEVGPLRAGSAVAATPTRLLVVGGYPPVGTVPDGIPTGHVLSFDPIDLRWGSDLEPLLPLPTFNTGEPGGSSSSLTYLPGVQKVAVLNLVQGGYHSGGFFDPETSQWSSMSLASSGFGFWDASQLAAELDGKLWVMPNPGQRNAIKLYDPQLASWSSGPAIPIEGSAWYFLAVKVGERVLVWYPQGQRGALYGPGNSWVEISSAGAPSARHYTSGAAIGSTRIALWGGYDSGSRTYLADGAIYDLDTDTWSPMSPTGAPSARYGAGMVWTGDALLVWGGQDELSSKASGASYDPATGTWRPMASLHGPALYRPVAAWTGTRALFYGQAGQGKLGAGGLYDPVADAWQCLPSEGAPPASLLTTLMPPAGVWTGSALVVVPGGASYNTPAGVIGVYRP